MRSLFNAATCAALALPILWASLMTYRHRRTAAQLAESDSYRALFAQVTDGILIAEIPSGRLVDANPSLLRNLGYSRVELTALRLTEVLVNASAVAADVAALADTSSELMQRCRDGSLRAIDASISFVDFGGHPSLCYVIRDAVARKSDETKLPQSPSTAERRYLAHIDTLTGLDNRQSFRAHVGRLLKEMAFDGRDTLALILLDLDEFSALNDTWGTDVGDAVLVEVARRLRFIAGEDACVARVGGDEFALALPGMADADAVARMAFDVQAALSVAVHCGDEEIYVRARLGISLCPPGETDVEVLLNHTDLALSSAGSGQADSLRFFNSKMCEDVRRRLELLRGLRHALSNGELTVHYQPIIDLASRRALSFEALVRWQHPRIGPVPPGEFIAIAEQNGLIAALGERVLRIACEQLARWRTSGLFVIPIAVNVSPQQFQWCSVSKMVVDLTSQAGITADLIAIEITEGSLMSDAERYAKELADLRAAGVRVLVDDFGTGYSSLSYLKHLPLDALKIDRSFITHVDTNPADEAIVSAILAMARSLQLNVIAEGVESHNQLAALERHGCQMAQGFYFSRPMPAEDCVVLLRELARRPSFTDTLRLRLAGRLNGRS